VRALWCYPQRNCELPELVKHPAVVTVSCAAFNLAECVMRVLNFFVVASVFAVIFIAIATLSALATGVVHGQLSARPETQTAVYSK
jgi:hypothetical protein